MLAKSKRAPEPLEVIHGSGNVYRDFGYENADALQFKASLAAQILKTLDRQKLTVRQAQEHTGIAAADFSRIRNADLKRFTLDRMMGIVNKLGYQIEISYEIKPMTKYTPRVTTLVAAKPKPRKYGSKKRKSRAANRRVTAHEQRPASPLFT